jgi:hypothetical protein
MTQRGARWMGFAIAAATLLIYLPAVFNNFVEWDDALIITTNPRFNPPTWGTVFYYCTHVVWNLYMPVTCMLWAALARLGTVSTPDAMGTQMNPYLFHLAQVLLQTMAATAVFGILRRVTSSPWAAAAGAMMFAIHPLQVESVAFVGAMNTPLAGALMLTAIWIYRGGGRKARWAASGLFVMAMLSKPNVVVGPAILILLDLAEKRTVRDAIRNALPWIVLVIPCLVWTKLIQSAAAAKAIEPIWSRPLIAGNAMMFYVRKFFVPWTMGIDYGRTPEHMVASTTIWWAWIVPAAMLAAAWVGRRRWPIAAAGIAVFFVAMLPNSGLVPFEYQYISTTADRYVYLSMLGAGMIVACWIKSAPGGRPLRGIVVGAALLACLVATELQIRVWWDGQTLFRHAIAVNPRSWMSRSNLGMILQESDPDEAVAQCRMAVELNPKGWIPHNNLAAVLSARDPDAAIVQGQIAVTLNPGYSDAFNNLGVAYTRKGDSKDAIAAFGRAHQLAPDNLIIADNYRRAASGGFAATRRAE